MKVAHVLKVMGGRNDTFFYRLLVNPLVDNAVYCHRYENRDVFPHQRVTTTATLRMWIGYARKVVRVKGRDNVGACLLRRAWRRFVAKESPDVVHVHQGDLAARLIEDLEETRVPLVVTFCGSDVNRASYNRRYLERLRRVFERAEQCHFVAAALLDEARSLGCNVGRAAVVYRGTAIREIPQRRPFEEGKPRIVVVANFVPCKGHETLLNAFRVVGSKIPGATLHIYGDGPLRDRLEWLISEMRLSNSVFMYGNIPYQQVQDALQESSDIAVLSSQHDDNGSREGLPNFLVEAAAAGLPLIGTRCGGIDEIVRHEETGLLVDQRDVNGLANAIVFLAARPDECVRLGDNARALACGQFDAAGQLERMVQTYRKVIQLHAYRTLEDPSTAGTSLVECDGTSA